MSESVPPMRREIRDQPGLWRRLSAADEPARWHRRVASGARLHLVGCGDMHFAARATEALAAALGIPGVRAHRSFDVRWSRALVGSGDLAIGASISGRTPRTVEALASLRAAGASTLALSDDDRTPIARTADEVLVLGTADLQELREGIYAGYSSEAPQTRTHTAVLWTLLRIAVGDAALEGLADRVEAALPGLEQRAGQVAAEVEPEGLREVMVLGSGPFRPVAELGAAKLLEFAIPAHAQCLEEYHHLEMFVADRGSFLLALDGDEHCAGRWAEVEGQHERLGATGRRAGLREGSTGTADDALFDHLRATVFVQCFALALAQRLGRDLERWVGGVRTDTIYELSNRTVRASRDHSGTI